MIYYDQDPSYSRIRITASVSLFSAAEAAAAGKLSYKHSENIVERMARVRHASVPFVPVTYHIQQHLNTKMISFAEYVVAYPLRSVFLLFVVLGLVTFGLKRLITNDLPSQDEHRATKAHRLD